jgi:hypothetical protein
MPETILRAVHLIRSGRMWPRPYPDYTIMSHADNPDSPSDSPEKRRTFKRKMDLSNLGEISQNGIVIEFSGHSGERV